MNVPWTAVRPLLARIERPSYGSDDDWDEWYEIAWSRLSAANLTQFRTPLDSVLLRLRLFALAWVAHDFCAAAFDHDSSPSWAEWMGELRINITHALLSIGDLSRLDEILTESELFLDDDTVLDVDTFDLCDSYIDEDLGPRIVVTAAAVQRDGVLDALLAGAGGGSRFFAELYAICSYNDNLFCDRQTEITEQLEDLESEQLPLDDAESLLQRQTQVTELKKQLEPRSIKAHVMDALRQSALNGPILFGEEETAERMGGFDWCEEGCPILVRGEPEVCTEIV